MYRTLALIFLTLLGFVSAQFDFFGNMFGQQQQQQQRQQPRAGASQWAAQVDNIPCSTYLCPTTLDCVDLPVDCPCPDVQDVKCVIPDSDGEGSYVCVRGDNECAYVKLLMQKGTKPTKTK